MKRMGRGCERVVVAMDSASLALSGMEAAFVLAAGVHVPVAILFVDDRRLRGPGLADEPHSPTVPALPGAHADDAYAPPPDEQADLAGAVPATSHAQAEQVRRLALAMAQRFGVVWSMYVLHGKLLHCALAALAPGDALVLHQGPLARFTLSESPPLQALAARPVLALSDGSGAAPHALQAAAAMARVIGGELLVLGADVVQPLPGGVPAGGAIGVRYERLPTYEAAALAATARAQQGAAFVLPAGPLPATAWLAKMADAIECPLVVVRPVPPSFVGRRPSEPDA